MLMNLIATIFAGVFAVAAALLAWWRRTVVKELAVMEATPTSRAADVVRMAPGTLVEVKGVLRCEQPIIAEFSQRPCLYSLSVIEREYERITTDSQGRQQRQRSRETVQSNARNARCAIFDDSGGVGIDFTGASVEAIEVMRRYESGGGGIGSLITSLAGAGGTLGHYYIESIIPPETPGYVLGTVREGGVVGAAPDKKNPFVISHKSEEERVKSLGSTKFWLLVAISVCGAVAAGLLIVAVVVGS
jgi:hypothetical protein